MTYIKLNNGKRAIVDEEDYEKLAKYKWYYSEFGYAARGARVSEGAKSHLVFMHREIMNTPKGLITDHINHNGLDNRKENLRICTQSENGVNRRARKKMVSYTKNRPNLRKKWRAVITKKYKTIHIGYFLTRKEAQDAYKLKARELFGDFAP